MTPPKRDRLHDLLRRGLLRQHGREVWDGVWSRDSYAEPDERRRRAVRRLGEFEARGYAIPQHRALLDIGCGSGQTLAVLARHAHRPMAGIDISPVALAKARSILPMEVDLRVADTRAIPFPDASFDIVTAFGSLEHCTDIPLALCEVERVLRPSGRLYLTTSNVASTENALRQVKGWVGAYRYGYQHNLSQIDLRRLLSAGFTILDAWIVQGDWDRWLPSLADRVASIAFGSAGRYVYAVAARRRTVNVEDT